MHSKIAFCTRSKIQKELYKDNLDNIITDYEDGYVEDIDEISELLKMVNIIYIYIIHTSPKAIVRIFFLV